MKKFIVPVVVILSAQLACTEPETSESHEQEQVQNTEDVTESGSAGQQEIVQGQESSISQDSLAMFEDLAVDDPEIRKKAITNVNVILKKYRDGLPNQASYSSMKLFETYTNEFLKNYFSVDQETKAVWAYYISAELILRAPENEMKNATETLARVEESCDCNSKEKQQLKEFNQAVLAQTQALLK